jgi:hypothetical protein
MKFSQELLDWVVGGCLFLIPTVFVVQTLLHYRNDALKVQATKSDIPPKTPGSFVCKDRWVVEKESECPDIEEHRWCVEHSGQHEHVWCSKNSSIGVDMGPIDDCQIYDEWKDTIKGVPMAVWKARCTLWLRGEYAWAADSGVADYTGDKKL